MTGFPGFREKHGATRIVAPPVSDEQALARYRDRLPSSLLEEWQISGWARLPAGVSVAHGSGGTGGGRRAVEVGKTSSGLDVGKQLSSDYTSSPKDSLRIKGKKFRDESGKTS
jgi:hypothetical protein